MCKDGKSLDWSKVCWVGGISSFVNGSNFRYFEDVRYCSLCNCVVVDSSFKMAHLNDYLLILHIWTGCR